MKLKLITIRVDFNCFSCKVQNIFSRQIIVVYALSISSCFFVLLLEFQEGKMTTFVVCHIGMSLVVNLLVIPSTSLDYFNKLFFYCSNHFSILKKLSKSNNINCCQVTALKLEPQLFCTDDMALTSLLSPKFLVPVRNLRIFTVTFFLLVFFFAKQNLINNAISNRCKVRHCKFFLLYTDKHKILTDY